MNGTRIRSSHIHRGRLYQLFWSVERKHLFAARRLLKVDDAYARNRNEILLATVVLISTVGVGSVLTQSTDDSPKYRVKRLQSRFGKKMSLPTRPDLLPRQLPQLIALGKNLFFDQRLSRDGAVSCSSCHDPAAAFADHNAVAIGVDSKFGKRNSMTVVNSALRNSLFSDGRAGSLEEQAKQPLVNPFEMAMPSLNAVVLRVGAIPEYRKRFKRVFGSNSITIDTIAKAIAAYERTLIFRNSPFDRFMNGDSSAISEQQKIGWQLFKDRARCINCHEAQTPFPLFTDDKFHNTGVATRKHDLFELAIRIQRKGEVDGTRVIDPNVLAHTEGFCELGRFNVTHEAKDIGAFKTPTLRDVELTSPYMHNGSIKTLIDVVRFYNKGGEANSHLDSELKPLNLNELEVNSLVEFMRALTSADVLNLAQKSKPQTRTKLPVH